ncbi:hypothetical protein NO559_07750 [Dasania sp. GY-MA-18]|uniref:Uncharacterized protein n=1 Tax=Dasania phycosphaerae TaxID=2950436 RepID=A0A9J6RL17_9GAMM|nr:MULTISPECIES: hypothetical protein [Dasania]MCR8922660.1 hypothetical protein [Dasania sp. GY-MA-18]MCZ0865090.1 hypothetical protein [Dasania phycosphaerae]MCZ0868816.1 hypothetical protein [Dasania phycosphaerae]
MINIYRHFKFFVLFTLFLSASSVFSAKNIAVTSMSLIRCQGGTLVAVGQACPTLPVIVFETDFSDATGYSQGGVPYWNSSNAPPGMTAVNVGGSGSLDVIAGAGVAGSNAMRLTYDPTPTSNPTITMAKHLTGNMLTGFTELYIRYRFKFPDNWKFGDGALSLPYWKWLRLWQNTHPTQSDHVTGNWSENRPNSHYIVANFAGSPTYGIHVNAVFGANDGDATERDNGSAGGPRLNYGAYIDGNPLPHTAQAGYMQALVGDIDWITNPGRFVSTARPWHTLEYRVKLATNATSNDGVFEVWFDGVKQETDFPNKSIHGNLSPGVPVPADHFNDVNGNIGMPVAKMGSGINWISFFDNMADWNEHFGNVDVDGYIDVNDLVVSTQPIGHAYNVGGP